MKELDIDLGKSYEHAIPSIKEMKEELHYPSFRIEGDKELDLPYEGTMLIHFCKREETNRTDADGGKHYSCEIQVKKIEGVEVEEEEAPAKSYSKDSEDAIDALAKKRVSKKRKESDEY